MALNPFFLQGSQAEQRLIQELINEQLKIYGVEVIYLPRKVVRAETIIEEITSSKFDDNFALEAYVNNYEGYSGAGDVLTKFGMSLRDELSLIISKERFEDFIGNFLETLPEQEILLSNRPKEGDLIYFPLGQRIFEVKFVEHEKPFYQLGKTYVYELQCELFEFENEIGGWDQKSTTVDEIDSTLINQGYITSLKLFSFGETATGIAYTSSGYIRKITLTNDGYDYTETPIVTITPAPAGGTNATAVAITTSILGTNSIKEILLTNTGSGYTSTPSITISGGNGVGAAATCELVTAYSGIASVSITGSGSGYPTKPSITFTSPIPDRSRTFNVAFGPSDETDSFYIDSELTGDFTLYRGQTYRFDQTDSGNSGVTIALSTTIDGTHAGGDQYTDGWSYSGTAGVDGVGTFVVPNDAPNTLYYYAIEQSATNISDTPGALTILSDVGSSPVAIVGITTTGGVNQVLISDAGIGYTARPSVTFSTPPVTTGTGNYQFNEIVTGSISGATARVKTWDIDTNILTLGSTNGTFVEGDVIVGSGSSATYSVHYEVNARFTDKYEQNDTIESEADLIVDFTESNPFGNY
jgi:hypothetical protein